MFSYFGMSDTVQRQYLAMLEYPDYGLDDLSRILGATPEEVRQGLETLTKAKLVSTEPDDDRHWRVLDPTASLLSLLEERQTELEQQQSQLGEAREAVTRMLADLGSGASLANRTVGVDRVIGIEEVRRRLTTLSKSCRSEVWSFNPGGPQTESGMSAARELSKETLDRGVEMRSIYLDSARNEETTRLHLQWMADHGAQIRLSPSLPTRLLVVDREVAVVPIDNEDTGWGALFVSEPGLVFNMVALYHCYWRTARPLSAPRKRDDHGLSEQDLTAVALWARGCTDGTVARRLGVSERTIRRIHDRVTAYLGSASRFQSGARAVVEGLLEPDDLR